MRHVRRKKRQMCPSAQQAKLGIAIVMLAAVHSMSVVPCVPMRSDAAVQQCSHVAAAAVVNPHTYMIHVL